MGGQFLDTRQRITEGFDDVVDGVVVKKEKTSYVTMFNRSRYTGNIKLFYVSKQLGLDANVRLQYRSSYGFVDLNGNNRIEDSELVEGYTLGFNEVADLIAECIKSKACIFRGKPVPTDI